MGVAMAVALVKKRREAAKGMPRITEVVHGSVVIVNRSCGKANCRCQKGFKHSSLYISQRHKGRTRMIYIPKRSEAEVRRLVNNYRKIKVVMDKISDVSIQMLTKGGR